MTLDRQAQAALDIMARQASRVSPRDHERGPDEWAAAYRDKLMGMRALSGDPEPVAEVLDQTVNGPDGPLLLRTFKPAVQGVVPALLFLHAGGFVGGSLTIHDPVLRALANASGCLVAGLEYRIAPEYPYPAAPEDSYAALIHMRDHADTLGIDLARITVGGDSAGGLLAAVVALMARNRGGPAVARLAMLYPNTDLRADRSYPSMAEFDGTVVSLAELHDGLALYAPPDVDRSEPYVSPLLADLAGLPPALVVTCEADPLRDEGEAFARRLREAGGVVEHERLAGMIHGVLQMAGVVGAGRGLVERVGGWVRGC
jgi:acetyl esterase